MNLKDFPDINYLQNISTFFLAIFVSICSYMLLSFAWYWILSIFSSKTSLLKSFISYNVSQIGKYIPGNFSHFIARGYLDFKNNSITKKNSLCALVLESLLLIFSSLTIVLCSINKFNLSFHEFHLLNDYLIAFYVFYVFLTITVAFYLGKNFIYFKLLLILFFYLSYFLLQGIIVKILIFNVFNIDLNLFYIASAISLSWIIGFLVPGAPAGLGLRELLIVSLLSGAMELSQPISISISIFYRFITMASEVILFFIFFVIMKSNE